MEQGIKFVITGDTKQLDQTLKQSEQSLKRYENNIANVQRSINQSSQESRRYQATIQSLNAQLKNGAISQKEYSQALERNRIALNKADTNTIKLQRDLQKLQAEYIRTKQRVDATNSSLAANTVNVSATGDSFSRFGNSLRGLGAAFGLTSGVFLFARAIQSAGRVVVQFDKSMVTLASILGTTREELKGLEDEIRNVASTSVNTINEVARLANSLATLGQSEESIKNLLKPINNLSIALQAPADAAGELLVTTLNAFGESTSEAQRYANVVANMRKSTALDFQKIKVALGFLSPAAKAAGLSFEEAGALLGVLTNNGIRASRSGRLLASSLSRLTTDGLSLDDALQKINESTNKQLTATKLFGTESFSLGLILADNIAKISDLTDQFTRQTDVLKKLTDEQLKTVSARFRLTQSAWQNFVTSVENGTNVMSRELKKFADDTSEIFNFLADLNKTDLQKFQYEIEQSLDAFGKDKAIDDARKKILEFEKEIIKLQQSLNPTRESSAYPDLPKNHPFNVDERKKDIRAINQSVDDYMDKLDVLRKFVSGLEASPKVDPITTPPGTVDPVDEGAIKKAQREAEKLKKQYEKIFSDLDKDIELIDANSAAEMAREVNEIFNNIAFDFDAVTIPPVDFEGQSALLEIKAIEQALAGLKDKVPKDIFSSLKSANLEQLTRFQDELKRTTKEAQVFSDLAGSAITGFSQKLIQDLQTGNAVMDAVVSSIISLGAEMLTQLIAQQAQGLAAKQAFTSASLAADTASATGSAIAGGASAGASTGLGAVAAIPAFIALLVGVVGAAFASIGSFAQGGIVGGGQFTGDNIPIFVNSGERILTTQDQSLLTQFLRGGYAGTTNRTGDAGPIRIEGEIRGDNIRLSNERAVRRNRRFGSGING